MNIEEKKSVLAKVSDLKKDLLMMRIKLSSGEPVSAKEKIAKKKEIARLFTKVNMKKVGNN
jgi:ribosomal protein L29